MSTVSNAPETGETTALAAEQDYVARLYDRFDTLREQAQQFLSSALRQVPDSEQAHTERNAATRLHTEQLAQYAAAETGLCFGKLEFTDETDRYIGLMGILDEENDYEPLLVDWRAPAARPFYVATGASTEGVRMRRHLRIRKRTVIGVDDELLDLSGVEDADDVTGETALLAALNAKRTGRMTDIVRTIQAEQDNVIRSPLHGVLVVQGGPGTGKTAVALHRAAYLLYTHREQLAKRGVLVVGPNPAFLNYVSQVLPSLGETGVLMATVGDLFPDVRPRLTEPDAAAEIKGRPDMVTVLARAVADRQRVPDEPMEIVFERETLLLEPAAVERAKAAALRLGTLHNRAEPTFAAAIIKELTRLVAEGLGADLLEAGDLADISRELREEPDVLAALDWLWPVLTPQRLLKELYASPELLESAFPHLSEEERALLHRPEHFGWTPADVPVLDEAMELLGEDDRAAKALAEKKRRERLEFAEGVVDIMRIDEEVADDDVLMAMNMITADHLADRQERSSNLTTAERAAQDRTWTFGHVIVDEAQELSAMAWRLLMRRAPARSMTLVGDVAQTGDLAGAESWEQVLAPHMENRWRMEELTVNYRTPAEIMRVATAVLREFAPPIAEPKSVRSTGVPPWSLPVTTDDLPARLAELVEKELAEVGEGTLGVIIPTALRDAVSVLSPSDRVSVLTVREAKGLEFDAVIVVEPASIREESPKGLKDLYVALTRATQRLGIVHSTPLPDSLAGALA
ncbi:AAA family ATPase [Allokutzneria sp. A3M-2-11 16]|uniref:HelD family protein n=1 Tax=Allokutzneria sp. A3M-2-11 16 TaxID=2962043 RepID=UPI0020B7B438|nr:UvrD-helicase domain-containing protein [Allokutzneria sp. A3M-2-11 16]MCP3805425.1 AAA family ATPase [Allokutzneria sp. A3M-2-11 16]